MSQELRLAPLSFPGKSGTAAASTDTKITISFANEILAGNLLSVVDKVFIQDIFVQMSGILQTKIILQGKLEVDRKSVSPNFTVIKPYRPPKRITDDIIFIFTEDEAAEQQYDIDLVLMKEV